MLRLLAVIASASVAQSAACLPARRGRWSSGTSAVSATWAFADSTGCYWRLRRGAETAPWPGPEVNPA